MRYSLFAAIARLCVYGVCAIVASDGAFAAEDFKRGDFYVAPDGDDAAPGSLEEPFATIQRAQQAVRELLKTNPGRDILVVLRDGTYVLPETLVFEPGDASPAHGVVYAAHPGEHPVISGGRAITGWTQGEGNRWTARVPEGLASFRDLYVNDARLTRARFPNDTGTVRVASVSEDVTEIVLDTPLPADNLAGAGAELVVIQNWSITRVPVSRSDGARLVTPVPAGWIGHGDFTTTSANKPAFLEHALAFLDEPGEWYLDVAAGVVHYQAAPGEDPNARRFVAAALDRLVEVRGTPDAPVRGLRFEGIAFYHASWRLPEFGYIGIQAGHYGTRTDAPTYVLPAAIELRYAEQCRFDRCRIAHTGASGIAFGAGCRDNTVTHCALTDIGGNGVMVGMRDGHVKSDEEMAEDNYLAADWPDPERQRPVTNEIAYNEIARAAAVQFGAVGIFDAFSDGTHIHHNHVTELPYTGISVGFRWNTSPTSQRNARVEFNHIHDVMRVLADGGGIYTLGYQPGAVLRGNLIYDVHRSEIAHGGAPNNGIFFDQGSSGIHIEDTIIYQTSGEPIRFNQTDEAQFTWGTNYLGIGPKDPGYPHDLARQAGP